MVENPPADAGDAGDLGSIPGSGRPPGKEMATQFSSAALSCPTLCDPTDCSTPVFSVHHQLPACSTHSSVLPGKSRGQRSLVGCSPWGHVESDTTERLSMCIHMSTLCCFSFPFGLPWWLSWQSVCLQCGKPGFDPWVMKIPWRKKWRPTPVLLPGQSHGWRSLVGCSPWGR